MAKATRKVTRHKVADDDSTGKALKRVSRKASAGYAAINRAIQAMGDERAVALIEAKSEIATANALLSAIQG